MSQGARSPGGKPWSYPRLGTNCAQCPEARRAPCLSGRSRTDHPGGRGGGGLRGHSCAGKAPTGEAGAGGGQGCRRKTSFLKMGWSAGQGSGEKAPFDPFTSPHPGLLPPLAFRSPLPASCPLLGSIPAWIPGFPPWVSSLTHPEHTALPAPLHSLILGILFLCNQEERKC